MAKVLCTGADRVLMETRALILRRAGHSVVLASSEPELISACGGDNFDVAVVGQTTSDVQKLRIFNLIRHHCPTARILELHQAYKKPVLYEADASLEVPADVPEDFAVQVEQLAKKTP